MKFIDFVFYLEELESVSSRLKKIELVSQMMERLSGEELEEAIYLCLGGLLPNYRGIEFNMAEKMVMRALPSSNGGEDVVKEYKKEGDLGIVAERWVGSGVGLGSIESVYKRMMEMATENGAGSQERKVSILKELLEIAKPKEAKYIVRVVLGKLRLGFSDKTILEAISKMVSGDRTKRKELDEIYQIYPDVGKLARKVKEDGWDRAVKEIRPEVGVPIMPALCQRLNSSEEIISKMGRVAVERKYDGTRVQIHFSKKFGIKTFSRNLEETSWMFPELVDCGKWIDADEVILDCEAVGFDKRTGKILPFQETITRKRKHDIGETASKIPLRFNLFDLMYIDGKVMINDSYEKRREKLSQIISKNETLVVDELYLVDDPARLKKYHELFLEEGYEGAVIKKRNGGYLPGRQGWNWVKIKEAEGKSGKLKDTLDLVVMGYYRGRGKRSDFGLGAFLVGVADGEKILTIAKIGTGLTDDQFRELKSRLDRIVVMKKPTEYVVDKSLTADVWVDPKVVVEIAADEITKSPVHSAGVALRFPRLVKFREDKSVEQITTKGELEGIKG